MTLSAQTSAFTTRGTQPSGRTPSVSNIAISNTALPSLNCYDPSYDIIFKELFNSEKNKHFLIQLINDAIIEKPAHEIQDITFLNTEIPQGSPGEKAIRYDIRATTRDGKQFIIEMQRVKQHFYEKRVVFYASRAYILQLEEPRQDGKRKKSYNDICPVIVISILDHTLFQKEKHFHTHYSSREKKSQHKLQGSPEFIFIELEKFIKHLSPHKIEDPSHMSGIEKWAYILKKAPHIKSIPTSLQNTVYGQALRAINKSTLTPEQREAFDKSIFDQQSQESEQQDLQDKILLANERAQQESDARRVADQRAQQADQRAQEADQKAQDADQRAQDAEEKTKVLIKRLKKIGISDEEISQMMPPTAAPDIKKV